MKAASDSCPRPRFLWRCSGSCIPFTAPPSITSPAGQTVLPSSFPAAPGSFIYGRKGVGSFSGDVTLHTLAAVSALLALCSRETACIWMLLFLVHLFAFDTVYESARASASCSPSAFASSGFMLVCASCPHEPTIQSPLRALRQCQRAELSCCARLAITAGSCSSPQTSIWSGQWRHPERCPAPSVGGAQSQENISRSSEFWRRPRCCMAPLAKERRARSGLLALLGSSLLFAHLKSLRPQRDGRGALALPAQRRVPALRRWLLFGITGAPPKPSRRRRVRGASGPRRAQFRPKRRLVEFRDLLSPRSSRRCGQNPDGFESGADLFRARRLREGGTAAAESRGDESGLSHGAQRARTSAS